MDPYSFCGVHPLSGFPSGIDRHLCYGAEKADNSGVKEVSVFVGSFENEIKSAINNDDRII